MRDRPYRGVALSLNPIEREEFEAAKQRGYLVTRGQRRDLQKLWLQWCEVNQHPYLTVKLLAHYADVIIDLTDQPYSLSPEAVDTIRALGDLPIWKGPEAAARRSTGMTGTNTVIKFSGIGHQHTDQVAEVILREALAAKAQNEGVAEGTNKTG